MGWLLTQLETLFNSNSNRLSLTIAFVFLTVGISMVEFDIGGIHIGFSSLLVCMMLGTVFCNICPLSEDLMEKSDKWTAPLFALFFVISGAGLELGVFSDVSIVIIGVVYILSVSYTHLGNFSGLTTRVIINPAINATETASIVIIFFPSLQLYLCQAK